MKRDKPKFCITIVQTFNDEYLDEAMVEFVKNLKELGAGEIEIESLVKKNMAYWTDEDETQRSIIMVEIIKETAIL